MSVSCFLFTIFILNNSMDSGRIIGRYTGEDKGPLLIVFGGMHGNEKAGIRAVDIILKMLEVEPIINQGFLYSGRIVGMRGNIRALKLFSG